MLINKKEIEVRFHEVDSLRIVWHGNFIKYFEIGREAFGKEFGLTYMQVYDHGFFMPIVKGELAVLQRRTAVGLPAEPWITKVFCWYFIIFYSLQ